MSVQLTDLIATVRRDSGLKGNPLFSDSDIASILTDGKSRLRDIFVESFAHWFLDTYDFTLVGGVGGNTLDLTNIPHLQMDQYLNRNPGSATPEPVLRLGSLAERAQFNGLAPAGISGGIGVRRRYDTDGDVLTVLPIGLSAGNYRLYYTPFDIPFALPVTKSFAIASGDTPEVPPPGILPGTGAWLLANSGVDETVPPDGGFDLTITFTTTNLGFNGTYHVVGVGIPPTYGLPSFGVSNLGSSAGFSSPATGSATYTYQPVGTRSDLPNVLTPWRLYLTTFACAEICKSRSDSARFNMFQQTLTQEEHRATKMAKTRTEGVRQAPMIYSRQRRRGWGYGTP